MGLLDLPPEILDYVINFSTPFGLEGLALSCKAIYERARGQIKEHNALTRAWKYATNTEYPRYADSLQIIWAISRKPIIAEYIESLSLWDRRQERDEFPNPEDVYDPRQDEDSLNDIKEFLSKLEFFEQEPFVDWWIELLEEDRDINLFYKDRLYTTIALLALLPNLKTLQLPDRWHEVQSNESAEFLVRSVDTLVKMSNSGLYAGALQSLETLLPFVEEGYDVRVGLQCLQPFMALKSIRNIYAVSCVAVDEDWGGVSFEWNYPEIKSPLTRLEFACCCMDGSSLSVLLANTPALKIFKYSHQTKWDGLQHDWNPGEFIHVLSSYCGKQITDLALTVDELHGDIINGLSSFHSFPVLERLEVDVESFCGPPLESGQRLGRDSIIPLGATAWTHGDIPCLGDMLPSSIQEVHLNTNYPDQSELALKALVKNIVDRRSNNLRILERVTIRQYRTSTAQDIADRHNITLETFDANTNDPRPRSMMPLWKREFAERVGGIISEYDSD